MIFELILSNKLFSVKKKYFDVLALSAPYNESITAYSTHLFWIGT
ncbi:hypothetical protein J2Z65_002460 [Paenibacillus aceris]|uniref:Uncharacterized protein n=1 Tax=Paenibacillus aceris TaxID=869555 RepID=A0ABS4HX48_9BACL|nr:hypothetical protein [Paenibacillus aceris]